MGMHPNPSKNINLPKLDKIIVRNIGGNYKSPNIYQAQGYEKKQVDIDVSNILKIEGRGNQRNDYSNHHKYDEPKKVLDRDLKAELRRIYNLKPVPAQDKQVRPLYRNVELPRIS